MILADPADKKFSNLTRDGEIVILMQNRQGNADEGRGKGENPAVMAETRMRIYLRSTRNQKPYHTFYRSWALFGG